MIIFAWFSSYQKLIFLKNLLAVSFCVKPIIPWACKVGELFFWHSRHSRWPMHDTLQGNPNHVTSELQHSHSFTSLAGTKVTLQRTTEQRSDFSKFRLAFDFEHNSDQRTFTVPSAEPVTIRVLSWTKKHIIPHDENSKEKNSEDYNDCGGEILTLSAKSSAGEHTGSRLYLDPLAD